MHNEVWFVLIGMAVMAVLVGLMVSAYILYWVLQKAFKMARDLNQALAGINEMVIVAKESSEINRDLGVAAKIVASELAMLRSLFAAQQPVDPETGMIAEVSRGTVPFPPPAYENFKAVTTEAKEDDTEIIDTSDKDLAEYEQIENLRNLGMDADDDDLAAKVARSK